MNITMLFQLFLIIKFCNSFIKFCNFFMKLCNFLILRLVFKDILIWFKFLLDVIRKYRFLFFLLTLIFNFLSLFFSWLPISSDIFTIDWMSTSVVDPGLDQEQKCWVCGSKKILNPGEKCFVCDPELEKYTSSGTFEREGKFYSFNRYEENGEKFCIITNRQSRKRALFKFVKETDALSTSQIIMLIGFQIIAIAGLPASMGPCLILTSLIMQEYMKPFNRVPEIEPGPYFLTKVKSLEDETFY